MLVQGQGDGVSPKPPPSDIPNFEEGSFETILPALVLRECAVEKKTLKMKKAGACQQKSWELSPLYLMCSLF